MPEAGILCSISSLPSPWGIGTFGNGAREFIRFLSESGHSCWQVLPMGPTGFGDSPYQSFSSFAGNPYFIDPEDLTRERLLEKEECSSLLRDTDPERVDYGTLYRTRFSVLRLACTRLWATRPEEVRGFCQREAHWLEDYALFMSLKELHGGASWDLWPEEHRLYSPHRAAGLSLQLKEEVRFWQGVQFLFFHQWQKLKAQANALGISVLGDLPIYVSGDSADVWAHRDQFLLDDNGRPLEVAGCPPDAFSETGQFWGNPLFRWENMKQDRYRWWMDRIAFQFRLYDRLRIDHFRGFESYYAIPYGAKDASVGRWCPGPGTDFFRALKEDLGDLPLVAEDLGFLTEGVYQLLDETGYPGMKVLQFAFDDPGMESGYLPHRYPENCVAYPGTHDNDTLLGWLSTLSPAVQERVENYLGCTHRRSLSDALLDSLWQSKARLTVVPLQDLLGLGSEGRMNTPSTLGNNWCWRALPGSFTPSLAHVLRERLADCNRLH